MRPSGSRQAWEALPRPIGFVLSGGSSLGALQVGMLQALQEAGLAPDLLVGTSVGALNAAFVAGGFTAERLAALAEIWRAVRTDQVFAGVGVRTLWRALTGSGSLASPAGLARLVERHLPPDHADLVIPCAAVATDLASGQPVVLRQGDLRRAVMASAAIPGVFPPVRIGARTLVDGGVVAQVPLLAARDLGARTLVVLDAGFP